MQHRLGAAVLVLALAALSACNPAVRPAGECEGEECCPDGALLLVGTDAGEVLRGTQDADCILGEGGDDRILSRDGADVALGGAGADLLAGGAAGAKWYRGDAGDDRLVGGEEDDHLDGGPGDDELDGRFGDDDIHCGPGDDEAIAGPGDDTVDCGEGDDLLLGEDGEDRLLGGEGDDQIFGGPGNDTLIGGPGRDLVEGGSGDDTIRIDESCEAAPGDRVVGGPGFDTVESPLKEEQLLELGFLFEEVEQFVEVEVPPDPSCQLPPPRASGEGSLCSLMQESAALVEATVADISETFDEQEGPREVVTFSDVVVHLGSTGLPDGQTLRLRTLRGEVPTIRHPVTDEPARLEVTHTPIFHEGERYMLPLRGTFWNDSPVVWPHYYRLDQIDATPMLVDVSGTPLRRVYGAGLREPVFAPLAVGADIEQIRDPSPAELAQVLSPEEFVAGWTHIAGNCAEAFVGKFSPFPDQRRTWDRTGVSPEGGGGILPPCIEGAVDPETGEELACDL